jgi:hypothetical protein
MLIEAKEIFAVEIEGKHYHLQCIPQDYHLQKSDLIPQGEEDRNGVYICDECDEQIV